MEENVSDGRILGGSVANSAVYNDDFDFNIGKANILREGNDIAIIACGTMVYNALRASDLLKDGKLEASVIDMHTIKPIDTETIEKISTSHNLIVTVEEHSTIGGLGSAVSEYLSTMNHKPPLLVLGIYDECFHYRRMQVSARKKTIVAKPNNKYHFEDILFNLNV